MNALLLHQLKCMPCAWCALRVQRNTFEHVWARVGFDSFFNQVTDPTVFERFTIDSFQIFYDSPSSPHPLFGLSEFLDLMTRKLFIPWSAPSAIAS